MKGWTETCRRAWGAALLAGLAMGAAGAAQEAARQARPQPPSVAFRADADFVEVPVIVTGRDGRFVGGLTVDDFRVSEDGEPQALTVFGLVDLPTRRPFRPIYAEAPVEPDVHAARPTFEGRLYVLLLDDLHTSVLRTAEVRRAARRFVEERLYAGDLAAVAFTSGRTDGQELTQRRSLLVSAIDRFEGRKLPSATRERLGLHLLEQFQEDMRRDLLDDPLEYANRTITRDRVIDEPYDTERAFNARRLLESVERVAGWMGELHGRRKALVMFSEGFDYDIYAPFNRRASRIVRDARDAIAAAQRANVSIYSVDARGLLQVPGEAIDTRGLSTDPAVRDGGVLGFQRELLMAHEGLITLAEETGGLAVVNTNDVAGGLERVVRDNSTYYLLGYQTDLSRRPPGEFRRIEVRVDMPDVSVRARRGFAIADPDNVDERRAPVLPGGEPSRAYDAAVGTPLPIGALRLQVSAAPFMDSNDDASVLVISELDGSAIRFEERDGLFRGRIELSVVALNYTGDIVDGDNQSFDLNLRPQTFEAVRRFGVRIYTRLALPAASRYRIRVGAYEAVGETSGVVPFDVELPDYDETPLALSGLVLTSTAAALMPTPRPDPELATLFPTPPSAGRVFDAREALGVFVELYARGSSRRRRVDVVTTVRNAHDGSTVFAQRDDRTIQRSRESRVEGYAVAIPLRTLARGTYVLRVEAVERGDDELVFREIPFEIR